MGILVSRGYVNSNFTLKLGHDGNDIVGQATNTGLTAYLSWIEDNYMCDVTGIRSNFRCPSSDELVPSTFVIVTSTEIVETFSPYKIWCRVNYTIDKSFFYPYFYIGNHGIYWANYPSVPSITSSHSTAGLTTYPGYNNDGSRYLNYTRSFEVANGNSYYVKAGAYLRDSNNLSNSVWYLSDYVYVHVDIGGTTTTSTTVATTTTTTTLPPGSGYYNCGYGCQWYTYNPGCSTCTPGITTTTSTTSSIINITWSFYNDGGTDGYLQIIGHDFPFTEYAYSAVSTSGNVNIPNGLSVDVKINVNSVWQSIVINGDCAQESGGLDFVRTTTIITPIDIYGANFSC